MEPTRDQELLARAIRASGLTPRQYAKRVLIRDPRLIRRWLAGQYQLPKEVRAHLEQLEKSRLGDDPTRQLGPISERTANEAISVLTAMNDFYREAIEHYAERPTTAEPTRDEAD